MINPSIHIHMKGFMIGLCAAGLMFGSCIKGGKFDDGNIRDGGHGIGIDTATVNMIEMSLLLDSIEADTIANDKPSPNDKLHSTKHIFDRVHSFYKLRDDQQCCSENYLKLRMLMEKVCRQQDEDIRELLTDNHWTLEYNGEDPGEDWSFQILDVDNVTMYKAEALVEVKKNYESKMKLHLVFERGDWYVDNFDMVSQVGFDAAVQVYEEHEVYYNEKEMMIQYIREAIDGQEDMGEDE